jgi:hypothetical protein
MNTKMNKLAVALVSVITLGGLGANAYAASADTTVTATVVTPITIAKVYDLSFGKFAAMAGGTLKVDPNGSVTATTVKQVSTTPTPKAALFNVFGDALNTYAITISDASLVLAGSANPTAPTESMALVTVSTLNAPGTSTSKHTAGQLDGTGTQPIYVGGTLTVDAAQKPGAYSGTVTVTVDYN